MPEMAAFAAGLTGFARFAARCDIPPNRVALLAECAALPPEGQADMLAHFSIEATRWVATAPDSRVTCNTCAHYRRHRCGNHKAVLLHGLDIAPALAELPQPCPAWASKAPMTAPPIDDRKKTADRGARGRFAMGNTASPGRPPGRGPVAEMREALAGDMQAIRITLDRVSPALRPTELPTALDLPADGTLADQARAVVRAAAAGDLAPGQGAQIVTALGGVAKIIETTELVARIEAPEARSQGAKK